MHRKKVVGKQNKDIGKISIVVYYSTVSLQTEIPLGLILQHLDVGEGGWSACALYSVREEPGLADGHVMMSYHHS